MTYAVIRTGGKQYRVAKDDVIAVERIPAENGAKINFDEVLLVGEEGKAPKIGAPVVAGAKVIGEVLDQAKGDKVDVIKFRRRKNYRRVKGHRQDQTWVKITNITTKQAAKKAAPKSGASTSASASASASGAGAGAASSAGKAA
ncbi:MAG: 50S ribosomal protein L21 [Alphaproteobacteria bacterium]|nr:50S ribosomal protein L21 [Alphaproteobacteria bacterium]